MKSLTAKRRKYLRLFACPYCRKKPHISIRALNTHIAKAHPERNLRVMLDIELRAYAKPKLPLKHRITDLAVC